MQQINSTEEVLFMDCKGKEFTFELFRLHSGNEATWPLAEEHWSMIHSEKTIVENDSESELVQCLMRFASKYLPKDEVSKMYGMKRVYSKNTWRVSLWMFIQTMTEWDLCHAEWASTPDPFTQQ